MTTREVTWLDAAIIVLADSEGLWMTAPEMIREIQSKDIRHIKNYGQAVRTLRAALNINSKKQYSMFERSEGDFNVSFALRERLDSVPSPKKPAPTPHQKRRARSHKRRELWTAMSNGLPPAVTPLYSPSSSIPTSTSATSTSAPSPSPDLPSAHAHPTPPPPPSPLGQPKETPTVVEIDPLMVKSHRSHKPGQEPGGGSYLCLPSPLSSILGPRRTLHVLNESTVPASLRPVRQVRKRRPVKDGDDSTPLSPLLNGYTIEGPLSSFPNTPDVIRVETCHSVPSYLSEVACVRPSIGSNISTTAPEVILDDPCCAQGDRSHQGSFEIGTKFQKSKSPESSAMSVSQASSSDSEMESDVSDIQMQPRPSSRLMVSRRLSQQRRRAPSTDYSQLSEESTGEGNDEDSEGDDVDVEDTDFPSTCYSRARMAVKRRNRPRIDQLQRKYHPEKMNLLTKKVEQKRNISSLFQPQSPLVSENMKSLLNMPAFTRLNRNQRAHLIKLLPAVDRVGPSAITSDCLNNSFFSSALREWVEQIATGSFTAEHRTRMRAEEKKKKVYQKAESTWKAKFFEENWGDRIDNESSNKVPDFSPYYPHHQLSSDSTAACLKTILNRYYGEEPEPPATSPSPRVMPPQTTPSQAMPPSMSTAILSSVETPPLPPPPPPPSRPSPSLLVPLGTELPMKPPKSPKTSLETPTAQTKLTSSPTRGKAAKAPAAAKTAQASSAVLQVQKRNHVAKRVAQKFTLPSLLNVKSAKMTSRKAAGKLLINPKNSVDKLKASKIIEQLRLNSQHVHAKPSPSSSFSSPVGPGHVRANSGQFLTRLPPRTPYQALLLALSQASKPSKVPAVPSPPKQQQQRPYISLPTTTTHAHSVFHDHFALLSEPHVPSEFCLPLTSLSLQYPIDIYTSCVRSRIARAEHSYAKPPNTSPNGEARGRGEDSTNAQQLNLKLSLPRSLLQTNDACGCDRGALVFCSQCQSLYHNVCSTSTLCSTCVTLKSLNLS